MTCKVMIKGSYVKTVEGKNGSKAGKIFEIPTLHGYAVISGERNPLPIEFGIPKPEGDGDVTGNYEPGNYVLAAGSFYVDSEKRLNLRRHLVLNKPDTATDLLLRVTVHGSKVHTDKTGSMHTMQDCDVHLPGEEFPATCLIPVRRDEVQPGEYFIGPESFHVSYNRLELLAAPQLLPWPKKAAA